VIVPARHLGELGRALNPSRPTVEVAVSEGRNQVFFTAGDVEMSSRLIEGRYPNYAGVIPADSSTTVRLSTAVLLRTARTAAVLARDIGNPLRLEIAEKSVVLHAQTAEVGEDEAPLSAVVEGEGMRIAINARYLLEVLGVIGTEQVELCLNGPLQPAVLRPVSGDDYLCIIMPVRVP
jgi:DNA polymerase-3 subunit beta